MYCLTFSDLKFLKPGALHLHSRFSGYFSLEFSQTLLQYKEPFSSKLWSWNLILASEGFSILLVITELTLPLHVF